MRLTFRLKLLTIVATAALAFVVLIFAETILMSHAGEQLGEIQKHYLPVIEYGPRLEAAYEHLRRGFQDSVAAQDPEALKKTAALKATFFDELAGAGTAITPDQGTAIRLSVESYCDSASDVSRRLIAGETGLALVNAISHMQTEQSQVDRLLKSVSTLDRTKLVEAFSAIVRAQATSGRLLVAISVLCLIAVLFLSLWLSRSVLRSFSALSSGFSRFGKGDFKNPIEISSHDELGKLATEANLMAARIQGLVKELDSFSYSVAHDLRAPLRSVMGFSTILVEDCGPQLSPEGRALIDKVVAAAKRMGDLIDALLNMSRLARTEMKKESVNLSKLAGEVIEDLRSANPDRKISVTIQDDVTVTGDRQLLRIVLTNLIGNAWKFSSKKPDARVEFGSSESGGLKTYFVRDNGAGFDMQYAAKLFGTFQRLHTQQDFEGTGVGLATVQSIIRRHGGEIWAQAKPGEGATFFFTLWAQPSAHAPASS